jgi:CheY-like chemotaxis protein
MNEHRDHLNDSGQRAILVVDDEQRIADTLALILASKGYAVQAAYEGFSAIEIYRKLRPDLVITDVVMPGMNGVEMAITLRGEFPGCRVLLFSGQAATAQILEDARIRGHKFQLLAKPVHPEELLEKVLELIGPGLPAGARTT